MIRMLFALLALVVFSSQSAEARRYHHRHHAIEASCNPFDFMRPCGDFMQPREIMRQPRHDRHRMRIARSGGSVIGGRPSGCPRAFCGCGASLHLFGRIVPGLNLARAWFKFPRTSPAPGMVAVRRGHVFVLKEHRGGNVWLAHDSNSGGGRTRIHERSIAGYTIVNPRA